jgi:Arm DNA-binding domain
MEFYDEQVRCLCIRNSLGGQLSFYIKKTVSNRTIRLFIGRYPEVSIEQARKKANDILYNIANEHLILPFDRKAAQTANTSETADAPKTPTVYELFDLYINNHAAIHCIRHEEMRKDFKRYIWDWRSRPHTSISNWMFFHVSI